MLIWLEGWEWQCCGGRRGESVAFGGFGDEFEWLLYPWTPESRAAMARVFGPDADRLTHWETHHGARPGAGVYAISRVRVDSIRLVHWHLKHHPTERSLRAAAGTGIVEARQSLYRWEGEDWEHVHHVGGWLVDAKPLDEHPLHVGLRGTAS